MNCPHCHDHPPEVSQRCSFPCQHCGHVIETQPRTAMKLQPQLTPLERTLMWVGAFIPLICALLPIVAWLDAWQASGDIPRRDTPITPLGKSFAWSSAFFVFSWLGSSIVFIGGFARCSHPHVRKYLPLWIGAIVVAAVAYGASAKIYWGGEMPIGLTILDWWHLHI